MPSQNYNPKEFEQEIYSHWMQIGLGSPETQTKYQSKYIIFDFDGVLADSLEAEIYATKKVDNKETETKEEVHNRLKEIFTKPPVESFEDEKSVQKAVQRIHQICKHKIEHGFTTFAGFIYELKKLNNVRFAINTTSNRANVDHILEQIDLEFDYIFTLENGLNKTKKNQEIIKNWQADAKDVYFITDTIRDFLETKENLATENILATDWGWQGRELLETVFKPEQILEKYSDIHRFFPTHCILMPPPNLTGNMHAGHSFQHFLMDTISRINRQKGNINLWYPGVDHAGIQLEGVIDKMIKNGDFDKELGLDEELKPKN